jgi:hypothetical protein
MPTACAPLGGAQRVKLEARGPKISESGRLFVKKSGDANLRGEQPRSLVYQRCPSKDLQSQHRGTQQAHGLANRDQHGSRVPRHLALAELWGAARPRCYFGGDTSSYLLVRQRKATTCCGSPAALFRVLCPASRIWYVRAINNCFNCDMKVPGDPRANRLDR